MAPSTLVRTPGRISQGILFRVSFFVFCTWFAGAVPGFGQYSLPARRAPVHFLAPKDQPPAASNSANAQEKPTNEKRGKYDVTRIGERRVDKGFNMYSIEQEQEMGRRMAEQVERHNPLLKDPVVTHYVQQLGERLARNSDARIPFTIKVVDSEQVNAFALPGGYLYVDTGLILAAQNESELAAVMAHEIAHVAARHATRNMSKVRLWNMASIPFIFLGGPVSMAVHQVSGLAFPFSVRKFSRDAEREADLLGIEYEYAAGYDPAAFVNFLERLKSDPLSKHFVARVFATHPMNYDRIERAQKEIATMLPARAEYVVDTSDFEEARQRLLKNSGEALVLRRNRARNDGPVLRRRTMDDVPPAVQHFGILRDDARDVRH
jgi:predicted Zn-dependent protease